MTTLPHLMPRLKKEQNYTSTPPLGLHGLFQGELHLYVCVIKIVLCEIKIVLHEIKIVLHEIKIVLHEIKIVLREIKIVLREINPLNTKLNPICHLAGIIRSLPYFPHQQDKG